ncbi:hypothetical protein [Pseudobacillus wudalianchiensis]|uniref:hypothetical protein n=1 Tax=Pseudobacillus wudalianchiensis TaxID=1743143 RepID=UPI0009816EAC|nr:hypothetical protein [Bacillus wudalianchiensis]
MYHPDPFKRLYAIPLTGYPFVQPQVLTRPPSYRPYPKVNVTLFKQSAQSIKQLVHESNLLLNKLTDNSDFAFRLMTAAQAANHREVERLVRSTGISGKAIVSFTPDVFRIELRTTTANAECCKLAISLRWR